MPITFTDAQARVLEEYLTLNRELRNSQAKQADAAVTATRESAVKAVDACIAAGMLDGAYREEAVNKYASDPAAVLENLTKVAEYVAKMPPEVLGKSGSFGDDNVANDGLDSTDRVMARQLGLIS